jgi:MscS family membrane protein
MFSSEIPSCFIDSSILLQLASIFIFTIILGLCARYGTGRLRHIQALPEWVKSLANAFYGPSAWLVWGYGLLYGLEVFAAAQEGFIKTALLSQLRRTLLVIIISSVIFTWKNSFQKILKKKAVRKKSIKEDEALILALGKLFSIFIVVITGLIILDIFDIQLTALYAAGGMGGFAIGFAAKDVVANFFGGLMIFINRPFAEGDWIKSTNKNFEGTVEQIGWYMTRLRTFSRRPLFIPNSIITEAIIENPERMYNRRIKEEIPLRYEDVEKVIPIVTEIKKMLKENPDIDISQHLLVHFIGFGPKSLIIEVIAFTKTTLWAEWLDIQQRILVRIAEIVKAHGAEITPPERRDSHPIS